MTVYQVMEILIGLAIICLFIVEIVSNNMSEARWQKQYNSLILQIVGKKEKKVGKKKKKRSNKNDYNN